MRFDLFNGEIQVVDNGYGIEKIKLDLLGNKLICKNDLIFRQDNEDVLKSYEETLSLIAGISEIVIIESLHKDTKTTYRKRFDNVLNSMQIKKVRNRTSMGTTVSFILF